jgi:hypothetical protein
MAHDLFESGQAGSAKNKRVKLRPVVVRSYHAGCRKRECIMGTCAHCFRLDDKFRFVSTNLFDRNRKFRLAPVLNKIELKVRAEGLRKCCKDP